MVKATNCSTVKSQTCTEAHTTTAQKNNRKHNSESIETVVKFGTAKSIHILNFHLQEISSPICSYLFLLSSLCEYLREAMFKESI